MLITHSFTSLVFYNLSHSESVSFLLVAQKLPSRKSSFSVGAKTLQRISPNVIKSHRKADKNVKIADSITDKGLVQDIENNRRNKFRRYGLLANAKARRKSSGEFSSSSDSEDCDVSSPVRSTSKKKTSIAKAMEILESDSSATYSDITSKENKVSLFSIEIFCIKRF